MIIGLLIILFLVEAYQAWSKYARKDRIMVSELQEPETQTFPGVTLCKGIIPEKFSGDVDLEMEKSKTLETWIQSSAFNNIEQ